MWIFYWILIENRVIYRSRKGDGYMEITVIQPKKKDHEKLRVAAYCRVSTEAEEQENSLENQKDFYENKIRSNPLYEYAGVYHDFGISGFKEKRPGFQKMIEDAVNGKIDLILTKSISRFARNTVTMLKVVRKLKSVGVGIFFELQNINTLSAEGELMLSIHAAFAQAESEDSSMNAYMTCQRKFREGIPAVRVHECYGYRLNGEGEIVPDDIQSGVVRMVYNLALEGIWPSKIKAYLNERGIPSAKGKEWDDTGVFRILRNEIYKGGVMMQKTYLDADRVRHRNDGQKDRYYIPNHHPAIVDEFVWNQVQEVLDIRSMQLKQKLPDRKMGGNSHNRYPLTDMLFCPHCGGKLHHRVSNGGRSICWCCSTKIKKGKDFCTGITVPENIAEQWNITEETTVFMKMDEFGRKRYSTMPKAEYESSKRCPYQPKIRKHRDSHSTYPLSGRMYCGLCGSVMHHQNGWNGREFWWCSKRVKQKACEGVRIPAEVADAWNFEGKIVVMEGVDENGERSYSYQSKPESNNENSHKG